jgi:mannose/cellobiose epimerase-like protein (N-acyl-D-glucosamine 2-epimerase family)
MHLLESALAWIAVDDDPAWRRMADAIAGYAWKNSLIRRAEP